MTRNKNKIIRSVTVSQSLGFCREVMIKMRAMGYDMVAITSPGPELDELRDKDGFHCVEVPMERHISVVNDLKSLIKMIRVFMKEKPQVVHSMTPKAGMVCMVAAWLTRVPVRIHTFTGLVWPTATGLKRRILMMTDWLTCACATHVIPEGQGVLNDLKNGGITKKPMKVLGYATLWAWIWSDSLLIDSLSRRKLGCLHSCLSVVLLEIKASTNWWRLLSDCTTCIRIHVLCLWATMSIISTQ